MLNFCFLWGFTQFSHFINMISSLFVVHYNSSTCSIPFYKQYILRINEKCSTKEPTTTFSRSGTLDEKHII